MKKLFSILSITIVLLSTATAQKKTAYDFYVLPMLLGEYGAQIDFGDQGAFGLHFSYYNPNFGLTGVIIQSQLGSGDELEMNTHGFLPGISYTHYSKGGLSGLYYGGLLRYKMAIGDVTLKDKYSGGTAYKGIVTSDINIHSVNLNFMIGYRWVFDNNFSLRLGGALGFQNAFINDVTYTIIEQYDDEGDEVVDDLEDGVTQYTKGFTKPVTFQLMVAIGFTK